MTLEGKKHNFLCQKDMTGLNLWFSITETHKMVAIQ